MSGFGTEIGCYKEMVILVQLKVKLEKPNNDRIFIQASIIQRVKYYIIIVGKL